MSPVKIRKASRTLAPIEATPSFAERQTAPLGAIADTGTAANEATLGAIEWQGEVRLSPERAAGTSALARRQQVQTGLLERALVLGQDHRIGPHAERPEVAKRIFAHLDALGEVGLSPADLLAFTAEIESPSPGASWMITLLFGALDAPGAEDAFLEWIASLEHVVFEDYGRVVEVADALRAQPSALLRARAASFFKSPSPELRAISLEMAARETLSRERLTRAAADPAPIAVAAFERYLSRCPRESIPAAVTSNRSWMAMEVPSFAFEIARARILRGDPEPLARLRDRHAPARKALGSFAMEILALAGEGADDPLAREISLGQPTTPDLLDAMGRAGLPSLFPRLLAELSGDFDDEARGALTTLLGPLAPEGPSVLEARAWEDAIRALPGSQGPGAEGELPVFGPVRFRGGKRWSREAVIACAERPDLSAAEVRSRFEELLWRAGKTPLVDWDAIGVPLQQAIQTLAGVAR
jgi:hypothetical protein